MNRLIIVTGLLLLTMGAGCTVSDALFGVFGDNYTGGGTTRAEKQYHYNQQVEASRGHGSSYP